MSEQASRSGMKVARRRLLVGAGAALVAAALPGCATIDPRRTGDAGIVLLPPLTPLRVSMDRITGITVCSRPFRAAGPRLEAEKIGQQTVVHHYGHGGSGWSLSWGSGAAAAALVMATGERDIGVIGCGAIGLTTALQLQRAGARQVTIYAKELPPEVLSSFATGVWSPASRIGMEDALTPAFKLHWQNIARHSWRSYQQMLGLPGDPVEFFDGFGLSDSPPTPRARQPRSDGKPHFAELDEELIPEIGVKSVSIDPRNQPFASRYVRRGAQLMFNLPAYSRMLMADFRATGGRVVIDEFHSPADFARLPHRTLVNCTGYGARALMGDESVVPVRGQLARLVPEPGARYGLQYRRVSVTPRRDALVLQFSGEDEYFGYADASRDPSTAEAERCVTTIASAFKPHARA